MDPNSRSVDSLEDDIQNMDIHNPDTGDQVVPGSADDQINSFTSPISPPTTDRSVPSALNNPMHDFMRAREESPSEPVERDSGYLSTPGAVGSAPTFFQNTSDIDGSLIQRYSTGDASDSIEDKTNDIECDFALSDNEDRLSEDESDTDQAVFFIDSYDMSDGRDNNNQLSSSPLQPIGNLLSNRNSNSEGAAGGAEGYINNNSQSSSQNSQPVTIPKKRRSHYLDNFNSHNNVFHTPPRGYHNQFAINRGTDSRSSTGSIQTLATPSSNYQNAAFHLALHFHDHQLSQGRNRIMNDESNPRRARFFSESFSEQENNNGTSQQESAGPTSGTEVQMHPPLRTRDRSLSAPAVMTLEKQFGQELRRISDDFDKEYPRVQEPQRPNGSLRHGRNHNNRRSFPGTAQKEPGWWQKFIQWVPLTGTQDGFNRHRTEPVLQNLVVEEEEEEEDDCDEVDGLRDPQI